MMHFELTFGVDSLSDDVLDAVFDKFDAVISSHPDVTLVTVLAPGTTALNAARDAILRLERISGLIVRRAYEDLVSRADIAERVGVSPQAVGQWVRRDRHKFNTFPQPFSFVGGGVWLWHEVNDWLRRAGKSHESDVAYPTREDHCDIGRWISERRARDLMRVDVTWTHDAAYRGETEED